MRAISGSILILAAAVLLQPAIESQSRIDEAIVFVIPVLVTGLVLLVIGLRKDR